MEETVLIKIAQPNLTLQGTRRKRRAPELTRWASYLPSSKRHIDLDLRQ